MRWDVEKSADWSLVMNFWLKFDIRNYKVRILLLLQNDMIWKSLIYAMFSTTQHGTWLDVILLMKARYSAFGFSFFAFFFCWNEIFMYSVSGLIFLCSSSLLIRINRNRIYNRLRTSTHSISSLFINFSLRLTHENFHQLEPSLSFPRLLLTFPISFWHKIFFRYDLLFCFAHSHSLFVFHFLFSQIQK